MNPSLFRCPKCRQGVVIEVPPTDGAIIVRFQAEVRCIKCAYPMEAIGKPSGEPTGEALQA